MNCCKRGDKVQQMSIFRKNVQTKIIFVMQSKNYYQFYRLHEADSSFSHFLFQDFVSRSINFKNFQFQYGINEQIFAFYISTSNQVCPTLPFFTSCLVQPVQFAFQITKQIHINYSQYNLQAKQMKEDSLLSSLSNVSYHYNNNNVDFFNDSSLLGGFTDLKPKQQGQQEEVDLNCLPILSHHEPPSPKRNTLLLAAYWTDQNNDIAGNSDIQDQESHEQKQIEEMVKVEHFQVKKQEPMIKMEIEQKKGDSGQLSAGEEQIGTVIKNETKNIPKNYGKAIITYIEKQKESFEPILRANGIQYQDLLEELSKKKKYINTIANLRDLWVDFKYARCMRILSNQFLRKYALQYIFNSRICNFTSHVKYRKRLQQAIEAPNTFRHIKQY